MLKYYRVRRVGSAVAKALTSHVHCPRYHADFLASNGFDDIVKYTDAGANGYGAPCSLSVEDLMPVKFDARSEAVSCGG